MSENLTIKKIISFFKKFRKTTKVKYEISKLSNQLSLKYSYNVSNKKFTLQGFLLKSKIKDDIKSTLNVMRNINNEM